jgi:uncharacterized protein (DUF433 family)
MTQRKSNDLERIIVDSAILVGKPVVRGTRIPVELVLKRLSQDLDLSTLFEAFPRLSPEDAKACLAYAGLQVAVTGLRPAGGC